MPPSRLIRLTEEEDIQLREIEQGSYLKLKLRLTEKTRAYMEERHSEKRTWNVTHLAEALKEESYEADAGAS